MNPFPDRSNKKRSVWGRSLEHVDRHIDTEKLNEMRQEIDPEADDALAALMEPNISGNSMSAINSYISQLGDASLLGENFSNRFTDPRLLKFAHLTSRIPSWVNWKLLAHGQTVFLRYASSAALGLLYVSLVGGFAAPKIVKVLDSTSYLTKNEDNTFRRLNETLEMVIDCMDNEDCLQPGQIGWTSVLKVRLLHSSVRRKLLSKEWDSTSYGLPINQEDLMATLLSFSVNVLYSMRVLGAQLSDYDELAYLHLWRYVGYLIGVKEQYNPCTDSIRASSALESIVLHLLHPSDQSCVVARHILRSMAGRGRLKWSYWRHSEAARMLLGAPLADGLGLETSWLERLSVMCFFAFLWLWSRFVAPYIEAKSFYFKGIKHLFRMEIKNALHPSPASS